MSHAGDFDDEDSFNDVDESGHMSDDSFNDDPQVDDFDHDHGDDKEEPTMAGAEAASSADTNTTTNASSSSTSSTPARPSKLAFEVDGRQHVDYLIQDDSDLRSSMSALVRDVAGVLHVPSHLASMLLRSHNWNKEKFMTRYFEDTERLLREHGLQHMEEDGETGACKDDCAPSAAATTLAADNSATAAASNAGETVNCSVCYDDYAIEETTALGCGHRFCNVCWGVYLQTAVSDGKLCILTKCAAFKCPVLVPDKTFENLTEPSVYSRHQEYLLRSYVEDNRLMRWCPAQRCSLAVRLLNTAVSAVKCRCGFAFCFRCGEENHAPASCDQLSEWLQKCKNESETAHWIIANCFPAEDHQIMTDRGFMYLHDVIEHFKCENDIGVACSVEGRLEYRRVDHTALTIHTGRHRHIQIASPTATTTTDEMAMKPDDPRIAEDMMSLCPTDNHRMLARVGKGDLANDWSHDASTQPDLAIHTAGAIFDAGQKDPSTIAEFVSTCALGAPGVDCNDLPFMATLGLETLEECTAFLKLYGCWLGAGTLRTGTGISFDDCQPQLQTYVRSLLDQLHTLRDVEYAERSVLISDASWLSYFESEYAADRRSHRPVEVKPRRIWSWVLDRCSRDQLRGILSGLQAASGNESLESRTSNAGVICTSSVALRDQLQQVMLHAGYTAVFECKSQPLDASARIWSIRYTDDAVLAHPRLTVAQSCTEVSLDGTVWCVTVPTEEQLIIVRRVTGTTEDVEGGRIVTSASRPIVVGNTKKCPKCAIRIEKNQGCNHMTCRGCKFEWCWVCHGDWQQHGNHTGGYYKCNKYDPKSLKSTPGEGGAEVAKAELNRYLHYYSRYHNHDQSKRFAEKQKIQTEKRMATMHAQSGGEAAWIDFQFMAAATQQVLECRSVLKYTYVFAYYLDDGPEKTLFEFLQQQLESSNEHLSELSELPPIDEIDRPQIVNYTRITNQFMNNLLNGVAAGLTPH